MKNKKIKSIKILTILLLNSFTFSSFLTYYITKLYYLNTKIDWLIITIFIIFSLCQITLTYLTYKRLKK